MLDLIPGLQDFGERFAVRHVPGPRMGPGNADPAAVSAEGQLVDFQTQNLRLEQGADRAGRHSQGHSTWIAREYRTPFIAQVQVVLTKRLARGRVPDLGRLVEVHRDRQDVLSPVLPGA